MKRRVLISLAVAVPVACGVFALALLAGMTPPQFVQWFQTRSQAARYDNYPTLVGSEHIETVRYVTSPDTFGPRVGQLRWIYSVPDGKTAAEALVQLQALRPEGYEQLGDEHCTELFRTMPDGPPGSTDMRGETGVLLDKDKTFTVVEVGGEPHRDGITFRIRSHDGVEVISADPGNFACGRAPG